ncbi:M48 family metallopeptidase [Rudaea cellulosilytica]|uniref:M48 family metallopeptidase n=1 Tax=Rudaea cellulosilytica TaxID=540746 RepID=UPI00035F7131|nr:M48 family metallopeptidase [Rudaea cellulosilytica]
MNFFAQQDRARAQTRRMLVLFTIAVVCIVAAVDLVVAIAFGVMGDGHRNAYRAAASPQTGVLVATTLVVLAVIGCSMLYKISSLRAGGGVVARQLGATLLDPHDPAVAGNFAYKRLRNVVEEIAIASGVPVPEVYVLENEPGINAFASGYTSSDAAITVTRGCLDKLTRDELQGVIAHEFSHVLNGDMRLNIRLMGVLFGILVIGIVGSKMLQWSGRGRDSNWQVFLGIALLIIGSIGLFFGRLIKAGVSRQREYLADASAVQFTRQSQGIAGALKKIAGLAEGSKLETSEREEAAHMFFGDGVGYSALFATHPPLHKRILAIDPQFDPQELVAIAKAWSAPVEAVDEEGAEVSISGLAPAGASRARASATPGVLPPVDAAIALTPNKVVTQVAHPGSDDYRAASAIHTTIADTLRAYAYSAERAPQVVLALALDAGADLRAKQLGLIEKYFGTATRAGIEEIAADVANLHPMQRLPLAQLAFPALRKRARGELQTFVIVLRQLIQTDGRVQLEEYCLATLVSAQVIEALDPSKTAAGGSSKLTDCATEIITVVATIARYGNDDAAEAARAFQLGMHEVLPDANARYAPPEDFVRALDAALPKLDRLVPAGKELLVRGLTRAVGADGMVSVSEAELLRTICAALHCPLPPLLEQAA